MGVRAVRRPPVQGRRRRPLLHTAVGVPLLLVRRVAMGADGIPLALSDHRYLAHRFALEVEFNSGPSASSPEPPGLRAVADPPQEIPS